MLKHFKWLCGRFFKFDTKLHVCPFFKLQVHFQITEPHDHTSTELFVAHLTIHTGRLMHNGIKKVTRKAIKAGDTRASKRSPVSF
ncbi:hypothetical protein WN55_05526 [Dufourea novaeangliae]|uniref:Uncharacterized protein n=1 Tax=Dufourea novaeangliae TaxID=178035 RepID=A0A154PMX5_DUFNO|nr:hypothetical protein WN55_05526 [Dufourea novaeangliae]